MTKARSRSYGLRNAATEWAELHGRARSKTVRGFGAGRPASSGHAALEDVGEQRLVAENAGDAEAACIFERGLWPHWALIVLVFLLPQAHRAREAVRERGHKHRQMAKAAAAPHDRREDAEASLRDVVPKAHSGHRDPREPHAVQESPILEVGEEHPAGYPPRQGQHGDRQQPCPLISLLDLRRCEESHRLPEVSEVQVSDPIRLPGLDLPDQRVGDGGRDGAQAHGVQGRAELRTLQGAGTV
mmetsp:Transcript_525/g.1757  ORF Transcript_525/g.1757 Transcript_525/m.1757 type:complete len:243 (-) Transcript_525:754-1482(-)